jgi:hypothetical protein
MVINPKIVNKRIREKSASRFNNRNFRIVFPQPCA